jgi:hypothetical protein
MIFRDNTVQAANMFSVQKLIISKETDFNVLFFESGLDRV